MKVILWPPDGRVMERDPRTGEYRGAFRARATVLPSFCLSLLGEIATIHGLVDPLETK